MEIKYELYRMKPGDKGMLKRLWENGDVTPDRYEKIRKDIVTTDGMGYNEHYLLEQLSRNNNMPGMREIYGMVTSDVVVLNPPYRRRNCLLLRGLEFLQAG